jgi:hypothetical protein
MEEEGQVRVEEQNSAVTTVVAAGEEDSEVCDILLVDVDRNDKQEVDMRPDLPKSTQRSR